MITKKFNIFSGWDLILEAEKEEYDDMDDFLGEIWSCEKDILSFASIPETIICIADLGLWDGRKQGYKLLNSELSSIFDVGYNDIHYTCIKSDGNNIVAVDPHHDGTNYYTFRALRSDRSHEKFLDLIYEGKKISKNTLNYYTRSIAKDVARVYGL